MANGSIDSNNITRVTIRRKNSGPEMPEFRWQRREMVQRLPNRLINRRRIDDLSEVSAACGGEGRYD